jgi:hypothetical protein
MTGHANNSLSGPDRGNPRGEIAVAIAGPPFEASR